MPTLPQLPKDSGIGQSAMTITRCNIMTLDQGVEVMAVMLGKQLARKLYRAQVRHSEFHAEAFEFALQKGVVKTGVVSDKQAPTKLFENDRHECFKFRGR